jgi:hypothetical protein
MMPLASFMTAARSFWFQKTCNQLLGKAPPLGTPSTPNKIRRLGEETVLASTG